MVRILIALITAYRWFISPYLSNHCRFQPTCSRYAIHALQHYGALAGLWLVTKRLLRCHPFQRLGGGWGYDPVPPKKTS